MPEQESKLLTLGEAAERLGVHANTMRKWADQGIVPAVRRPGGHRRFEPQVIEEKRKELGFRS
jgi:excisionase family DNA binding protein